MLKLEGEKITRRILAAATVINTAIIFSLKQLFSAPRPKGGEEYLTASFPSGHAATAFIAAEVLSWRNTPLRYLFLGIAALVVAGRVIIGAHFIHDIISAHR